MNKSKPAILGGKPIFKKLLSILQPTLPAVEELVKDFNKIFLSYQITNANYVRRFEEKIKDYLGVKYAICTSSCTTGLMLVFRALNIKGEVIVPSFTFAATVQSLLWNNLKPVFVDCNKDDFNIDTEKIEEKINSNTVAILAVYIFGVPPDITSLKRIARKYSLYLIFDAAHAFGSKYKNWYAGGFGDAEVFSFSPTKIVVATEGGVVTTSDKKLAYKISIGRNYANPDNYDSQFVGLNARMSELHACIGLYNLKKVNQRIRYRKKLNDIYRKNLKAIPGVTFQKIREDVQCSFNYFPIIIDAKKFGLTRDILYLCLEKENIQTRKYFYPAVHNQKFIRESTTEKFYLPVTEYISKNILCLPMYSHLKEEDVIKVCEAIHRIYKHSELIKKYVVY